MRSGRARCVPGVAGLDPAIPEAFVRCRPVLSCTAPHPTLPIPRGRQVRERLQVLEMEQAAARAEQRTLATSEAVLQLERDVAQQLHRHLERIASFETDRLSAAATRVHALQAPASPHAPRPHPPNLAPA